MMQPQEPILGMPAPALDLPITTTAVERLVENILLQPGLTSDYVLTIADAVQEVILEAPSTSDTRRLRDLRDQLRGMAPHLARVVPGKAEAEALLRVCPATAASLRMWRASMPTARSAWGWVPLLAAMIAAAEEMERATGRTA